MNTAAKLKLCNKSLGITVILMLASGIQLEATSGRYEWSVWAHIALGIVLTLLVLYHVYLHYRNTNWFSRFAKNKNKLTRVLWWVFLLVAVSGIAASVQWIGSYAHTPLGAVHGKIGFLMVLLAIIHAVRHRRKHAKTARTAV